MKQVICLLLLVLCLAGCASSPAQPTAEIAVLESELTTASTEQTVPTETTVQTDHTRQEEQEENNMIKLTIGEHEIYAKLAENETTRELAELLKNGPIAMSAYNYGGFEKVCSLGTRLTSSDVQTTTQAGDIMLYSCNQIVIFYSSNSWAYTRLAKVSEEDIPKLQAILSGNEDTVIISLA